MFSHWHLLCKGGKPSYDSDYLPSSRHLTENLRANTRATTPPPTNKPNNTSLRNRHFESHLTSWCVCVCLLLWSTVHARPHGSSQTQSYVNSNSSNKERLFWFMQIGTHDAAIMHYTDGYADADCHFDLEVLRAAVKELIVRVIMVFAETTTSGTVFFFKNLLGSSR